MHIIKNNANILILYNDFTKGKKDNLSNNDDERIFIFQTLRSMDFRVNAIAFKNTTDLIFSIQKFQPDLIFNLFKAAEKNDPDEMHIVALMELLNLPYIGHSPFILGLSNMKNFMKRLLENKKIPAIEYQIYRDMPKSTYLNFPVSARIAGAEWLATREMNDVISDFDSLKDKVKILLNKYEKPVIVEKYFVGRIFQAGVFGNKELSVLPLCELNIKNGNSKLICPTDLDSDISFHIQDTAIHVYKYLMGRDFATVSFLVDNSNKIYVVDYHPNPSISPGSVIYESLKVAKQKFEDFLYFIINEALARKSHVKN